MGFGAGLGCRVQGSGFGLSGGDFLRGDSGRAASLHMNVSSENFVRVPTGDLTRESSKDFRWFDRAFSTALLTALQGVHAFRILRGLCVRIWRALFYSGLWVEVEGGR